MYNKEFVKSISEKISGLSVNRVESVALSGRVSTDGYLEVSDLDIIDDSCSRPVPTQICTAVYHLGTAPDMNGFIHDGTSESQERFFISEAYLNPIPLLSYLSSAYPAVFWSLSTYIPSGSLVVTAVSTLYEDGDFPALFVNIFLPSFYQGYFYYDPTDGSTNYSDVLVNDVSTSQTYFHASDLIGSNKQYFEYYVKQQLSSRLGCSLADISIVYNSLPPVSSGESHPKEYVITAYNASNPVFIGSDGYSINNFAIAFEFDGSETWDAIFPYPNGIYKPFSWSEQEQQNSWSVFPFVVCTPYSRTRSVRHSLYFGQLSFVSDHANLDDVSVFNRFSKDTLIHKYRRYNYDIVHDIENILFSSICLGNATHFRFVGYKIHFDI